MTKLVIMGMLSLAIWVLFGCIIDSDDEAGNEQAHKAIQGEWESLRRPKHTLGDSLYREKLKEYMHVEGIDLDSFAYGGPDYPRDTAKFNELLRSFVWTCPAGVDCNKVKWEMTNRKIFTADSLYELTFENSVLSDSNSYRYTLAGPFLIIHDSWIGSTAKAFEFLGNKDTLRLYTESDTLGIFSDTLVRIE